MHEDKVNGDDENLHVHEKIEEFLAWNKVDNIVLYEVNILSVCVWIKRMYTC